MPSAPIPGLGSEELQAEIRVLRERLKEANARVAESAQQREAFELSEDRLAVAQRAGRVGTFEWDPSAGTVAMSEEFRRIWGLIDEVLPLSALIALVHPEDRPSLGSLDPTEHDNPLSYTEYRITRPDNGEVRWIARRGEVRRDAKGTVLRGVGVVYDVTETKCAEAALRASERRLRLAIEAGRMAVWLYDTATDSVQASPELNRLLGFPPDAAPSMTEVRSRYFTGELERLRAAGTSAMQNSERYFEVEFRTVWPDTSIHWLLLRAEFVMAANGVPYQVVGVLIDITSRKVAEEHQRLLLNELNHRVKNTLATVQSIVSQTLRNSISTAQAHEAVESRLFALSRVHDVLTRENWDSAQLSELIDEAVVPYRAYGASRLITRGPDRRVSPRIALALAMGIQELATNAVKYGALSNEVGTVTIEWRIHTASQPPHLYLEWSEKGGPTVKPPARRGFGTRMLERGLARDLDGTVEITFEATGLSCIFDVPLA